MPRMSPGRYTRRADVVVIGSGPGGATVARGLARAGRNVLLLERGRDWRSSQLYGTYAGPMLWAERGALLFTKEGLHVVRPTMLGGATSMYCACSSPPAAWWRDRWGIALDTYARAASDELRIAPLPPELRGNASTRIAEAAGELGMPWVPQDKFMQPARTERFDCGAHCMLGCRCGAKWNAAEWVDDAARAGATVWTRARADRLLIENGAVSGVAGTRAGKHFTIEAGTVIVAAGGIGSAMLLRASGLDGAGRGIAMDTTTMVYGVSADRGSGYDPPMTWSRADDAGGVMFSTLVDPWLMYPIIMGVKGLRHALAWPRWGRSIGVMIKLRDEISGGIDDRGRITKGTTPVDRERLRAAEQVATRILRRAGCDPDSIVTTPLRGTHPSATVRIGAVLDTDLRTEVEGLYVCDASVFPEALGRPTVLTIIALAMRLADHLTGGADASRPSRADALSAGE